ncbi:MAG: 30S ribosomal protein S4e [Candidatus Thermoplasmatota archaeon]
MSKHLKRLTTPRTWKVSRKEEEWAIKPTAGPHHQAKAVPLGLILRDYLELSDTKRESKRIISSGGIKVDGNIQRDYRFSCGFMDVISIPKMEKHFRILFDRKSHLVLVPIETKNASWKLCQIKNKMNLKNAKIQLNLHDGKNITAEKDEYNIGDVIQLSIKNCKIKKTFRFNKGTVSMITGGKHIGEIGEIKRIETVSSSKSNLVYIKSEKEFSTLKDYVFPIGKTKPVITLPEVKL